MPALAVWLCAAAPALAQQTAAASSAKAPLSAAQKLMFDRPHLKKIHKPVVLIYDFQRKGMQLKKLGLAFKDRVRVIIDRVRAGGGKDISFEFFTGKHRLPYADIGNFHGNPILMLFLNNDLRAQRRVLGGQVNYFRNRIRDALAAKARVEDVTVAGPSGTGAGGAATGGAIAGKKITITPYAGDRNRAKFKAYEHKVYEFILAPGIPGEVYMLRSFVPNTDKSLPPLAEETLKFASVAELKPRSSGATADRPRTSTREIKR